MKYLHTFELKTSPEKEMPKFSITTNDLLKYIKTQKYVDKFRKKYYDLVLIYAKEYIRLNKNDISDIKDYDIYDIYIDRCVIDKILSIIIYDDDTDHYITTVKLPIEDFVDFCDNYEMHINAKKYNL